MTVGVVGLGLIGGSIGLALREPGRQVVGYDPSPQHSKVALDRFCVDRLGSLAEVSAADVVFVAAPPQSVVNVLEKLATLRGPSTIVTDCTSVKGDVVAWAAKTGVDWFVPGHPMAGHEKSGPGFASSWMFRNARWILSPTAKTGRDALKRVTELVKAMGAVPVKVDPATHDRQVAILSHLPHALAATLVLLGEELERTDVSGGSWRDLTRVGGVDPELWTQIFSGNRRELARALGDAEAILRDLRTALEENDAPAVHALLTRAQAAKRRQENP